MKNLEKVIREKIEPIINESMLKFLGITVSQLNKEITDNISKKEMFDYSVDIGLDLKKARDKFRREYFLRLLQWNFFNISKVAKLSGVDRRTLHRELKKLKINIKGLKKELHKKYYFDQQMVEESIRGTLEEYKSVLNPKKIESVYENVEDISKNVAKEIPKETLTLKDAEDEFEKRYFRKLIESFKTLKEAAKKAGIRYETLHRKVKAIQ